MLRKRWRRRAATAIGWMLALGLVLPASAGDEVIFGDGFDGPLRTGLDFASNGAAPADAFIAFQFLNPQQNGLPIWGPGGAGATYVWRVRPRQQAGYYVTMWWSNNGGFLWGGGSPNTFYGGHPYPRGGGNTTLVHDWEIATDRGGDFIVTRAGTPKTVVKDRWYLQALRATPTGTPAI